MGTYYYNGRPLPVDPQSSFIRQVEATWSVPELESMVKSRSETFPIPDRARLDALRKTFGVELDDFRIFPHDIFILLDGARGETIRRRNQLQTKVTLNMLQSLGPLPTYFHSRVQETAGNLFKNKHYRQAVLDAFIALNEEVKKRSGRSDLDGKNLMTTVFSRNSPVIRLSDDDDEQEGCMHLFAGAMQAVRNPHAHTVSKDVTQGEALEWLSLASALFRRLP